jgi:DNA-binding MarR family transcriptional regulator
VALNDSSRTPREKVRDDLLDELSAWSPRERVGAFRHWLRGSLSLIHLHVLTVIESDGPLPMSKLADALDVSVASMTGIVDRMEERGLVERRREVGDRRVVLVHGTDAGDAVFRDLATERRGHIAPLLDRMTDAELESFLVGLRALRRARTEATAEAVEHGASS